MSASSNAGVITGTITERCLHDILNFAREATAGEGQSIISGIMARHPRAEHIDERGIQCGLYGDTRETVGPCFLAEMESCGVQFCIYLPRDEAALIEDGLLWLHKGDTHDTIYLTEASCSVIPEQGRRIRFNATWIERLG